MPRYTTLYVPEPYRRQFVSTGLIKVYTRVICSYQDLCVTIVTLAGAGLHGLTQGRQENIVSARSRVDARPRCTLCSLFVFPSICGEGC
jgi:hypothetical protein